MCQVRVKYLRWAGLVPRLLPDFEPRIERVMAVELTQDAVLHFLQSREGSVTNAELLLHFRPFLRDHADRERNRELFKKFVNSVARVKQEHGVSYVVLQRRFRGHVYDVSKGTSGVSRRDSPGPSRGDVFLSPPWTAEKPRNKSAEPGHAPPSHTGVTTVLPAAGIIITNNNNKSTEPNLNLQQGTAHVGFTSHIRDRHIEQPASTRLPQEHRNTEGPARTHREPKSTPETEACAKVAQVKLQEPREPKLPSEHAPAKLLSRPAPQAPSASQVSLVCEAPISLSQTVSKSQQETSAKPVPRDVTGGPSQQRPSQGQKPSPRRVRLRQSYRSAVSVDDDEEEEEEQELVSVRRASAPLESAGMWNLKTRVEPSGLIMSKSTPCLESTVPQIQIQDPEARGGRSLEERHATTERGLWVPPPSQPQKVRPAQNLPQILIQDLEPDYRQGLQSANVTPEQRLRTPSPARPQNIYVQHSPMGSSSSLEQAPRPRMWSGWSSCEELSHSGASGGGAKVGALQSGLTWQQSAEDVTSGDVRRRPWHHSAGDLCDDGAETSDGSASSSGTRLRPAVARRMSSKLRNRMCLSMGADLDQLLQEEDKRALGGSEAARLHRLQLISSSLSLRCMSSSSLSSCSTPPRNNSLADLTERDANRGRSSSHQLEAPSRQVSQVPLEEREHLWLVKAAAGAWPDIYCLFREDSSLLQRRDFISGFTVLHWIAKHGDHRVLNTLWYGVEKAGMTFETDAKSSCGYTPLHIAAMHSHKNIIRLLVNKFRANVSLRDAAGRKAWFYLPRGAPPDIFQLLGAPPKAALSQTGVGQQQASTPTHRQSERRRRRHHFSSASGERPLTFSGNAKVKRSTSLAAFLKHKSLHKAKTPSEWAI